VTLSRIPSIGLYPIGFQQSLHRFSISPWTPSAVLRDRATVAAATTGKICTLIEVNS
jgi:hypothetical protein